MKKTFLAIAISAVLAAATLVPSAADARSRGVYYGVAGGLVAGAVIGGAAAAPYGYYGGGYYSGGPYYGAYAAAPCGWRRERVWDGYGYRIRRVRVCY